MKGVILASHGDLAKGLLNTSELFFGKQEQLVACCIYQDDNPDDFSEKLKKEIINVDTGDGVIVLCDLLFGTPCNCLARLINEGIENFDVITGMNLAILLQILSTRENMDIDLKEALNQGVQGIQDLKEMLNKAI